MTNILDVIKKIGDIQFQHDVWMEGKFWDRVSSFSEAVNTLDDYCFFDDIKNNTLKLSNEDYKQIIFFAEMLLNYEEKEPRIMLEDRGWRQIIEESKIVYKILEKYKITNSDK